MLIDPLVVSSSNLTAGRGAREFWGHHTKQGLIFRGKNFNNAVIRQVEDEFTLNSGQVRKKP